MDKKSIRKKIIAFINAAYLWHKSTEGNFEEGPGKEMAELEIEILTAFGLPYMAQQYSEILQEYGFSNKNTESRATGLLKRLTEEAESYLLAPIEKDTEILKKGKRDGMEAIMVLPLMGITTTCYHCFLYHDIYLRGKCTGEILLQSLKKSEVLDNDPRTRIPDSYREWKADKHFKRLNRDGLIFLHQYAGFLKYCDTEHGWDGEILNHDLGEYFSLPDIFHLKKIFISSIYVKNKSTCCITAVIYFSSLYLEITLWCTEKQMRSILQHAKYNSFSAGVLYYTRHAVLNKKELTICMKKFAGHHVETVNIIIGMEKLYSGEEKINDEFTYFITSVDEHYYNAENLVSKSNDDLPF